MPRDDKADREMSVLEWRALPQTVAWYSRNMAIRKVGNVDVFLDTDGFVESIQLCGRALYLTADPAFLKKQFRGEDLDAGRRSTSSTATSPPMRSSKRIPTVITTMNGSE